MSIQKYKKALEQRNSKTKFLKQLYFCIHCHLSYANIAWPTTYKSKLEGLYHHQKHAALTINFKDKFTHALPLRIYDMKSLNIFQINLFHIICFMFKCKEKITPTVFDSLFTPKPENKYNIRSRGKLTQFNNDYRSPHLWNEFVHDNFSKLDSLPLFRKKIKEFILMFHDTEKYF